MSKLLAVCVLCLFPGFLMAADPAPAAAPATTAEAQQAAQMTPQAPPLASLDEARSLADKVMAKLVSGEVGSAMELLAPHFPVARNEQFGLSNRLSRARAMVSRRFGPTIGYEFVEADEIKDTLVRFTYVEKRERSFTRWLLTFYRPRDAWVFFTVAWDSNLDALLD